MEKKIITVIILFFHFFCFGQKEGKVYYKQIINKTSHNAELIFDDSHSTYAVNRIGLDSITQESVIKNTGVGTVISDHQDEIGELCYKNFKTNLLFVREFVFALSFVYEEPIPKIKWILTDSTKKIGNFKCQMARTSFRGREYTVWFSADVPINTGPWKFNGLPGLILEVKDNLDEIQFIFLSIEYPAQVKKESLEFPKYKGKKITFEEHKTIVINTVENAKNTALLNAPKGTRIDIDIDPSGFIEKSYEK